MISWEILTNLFPGVSTKLTRRLLIGSFAIFYKHLHKKSLDISVAATPIIVSLSKLKNRDKYVRLIQTFHTNNDLSRMQ